MKTVLTLASLLLASTAHAAIPTILFGSSNLTHPLVPNQPTTVIGPLVQLQTSGGTILSFQQGSTFTLNTEGTVTLAAGNLRMGPAGDSPLTLNLPGGPVTVAALTALTVTVNQTESSGRIYHGSLTAANRTFTSGEGFALSPSGARGTFTPAAAQAPALTGLASIEPAAGPAATPATPPAPTQHTDFRTTLALTPQTPAPATEAPATTPPETQPETTPNPPATEPENPTTTPPATTPDQSADTPADTPADTTTNPPADPADPTPPADQQPDPTPDQPVGTPPDTTPTPDPQPDDTQQPDQPAQQPDTPASQPPETPVTLLRSNLYAAFSSLPEGVAQPDNVASRPGAFVMSEYPSTGEQQLEQTQATFFGLNPTTILRGTALQMDATSHGTTSGLGRWVGGQLTAVTGQAWAPTVTPIDNTDNSVHYIWGEKPTNIPVSSRINYTLFSATQPTYTSTNGPAPESTGATFNGNLAIDFAPSYSGSIGTYHFSGTVNMPEVTQTATGPATITQSYNVTTRESGVPLTGDTLTNPGALIVTAPTGAIACPSGCTGTVNAAGFGAGMKDAGTLYAINPTGSTGITGAAIFTAAP